jgi:hypothetical protein
VVQHHQLLRYALSIAAVLKAQFSASKWLPGGEAGAAELATTLDLGTALLLRNVDLASLRDPSLRPKTSERPAAKRKVLPQDTVCSMLCVCAEASLAGTLLVKHRPLVSCRLCCCSLLLLCIPSAADLSCPCSVVRQTCCRLCQA